MTKGALSHHERAPFRCPKNPFCRLIKAYLEHVLAENKDFWGAFEMVKTVIIT